MLEFEAAMNRLEAARRRGEMGDREDLRVLFAAVSPPEGYEDPEEHHRGGEA